MIAAKSGYIADFKTGYLQRQILEPLVEVMGGADTGDGKTGFATARLVKLTRLSDGSAYIVAATGVSATSIGDATHIIAQSDDTLPNVPDNFIKAEKYQTRNTNILSNTASGSAPTAKTATMKAVAFFKIVNADDIKIIEVKPATVSVNR